MITDFSGEYAFLSNFHPSPFRAANGKVYQTVEHFFQAHKATTEVGHESIRNQYTPGRAKRRGQIIPLRPDWEDVKLRVMAEGLALKFTERGYDLADRLIATYPTYLIEGNTWGDRYWGAVLAEPEVGDLYWEGENHLGLLLMMRRQLLLNVMIPPGVVPSAT